MLFGLLDDTYGWFVGGGVPDAPMGTRTLRADIESAPTAHTQISVCQCGPMTSIGPYRVRVEGFGPGGVNVGRVQSAVKKMQSLLHF